MVTVTPLKSFDHNGVKRKGEPFQCTEQTAKALLRSKLVAMGDVAEQNPFLTEAPSSALPPVQASPQTIAKPSASGAKRGRKKRQ